MVSNPLNGMQEKVVESMMSKITPSQTPEVQSAVQTVTKHESRQVSAVSKLADAADVEHEIHYDRGQRSQLILSLLDAAASQQLVDWWFDVVGSQVMHKHEKAKEYVGLDAEEWRQQLREWYSMHYDAGTISTPIEEASPGKIGEVAARHVQDAYGLTLREFVALVVCWDRSEQIEPILAGPMDRNTQVIWAVAEEIDEDT